MDKRILYGGAAALAAYFWWASRNTASTSATAVTRTPNTTPNGVGFDIGAALGALGSMVKPATTAPDANVINGVTVPLLVTGPAPAETVGYSGGVQNDGRTNNAPQSTLGLYQQMDLGHLIRNLDFRAGNEGKSAAALYDYMATNKIDTSNVGAAVGWSAADVSQYIYNATGRKV